MQFNQTNCFKVFEKHHDDVKRSLEIEEFRRDDIESYVFYRAFAHLKLDILLIQHRQLNDPEGILLFGKNALNHYLFTKKGIPITEAKNMHLHDIFVVLLEDLSKIDLTKEILSFLNQHFYNGTPDFKNIPHKDRTIKDDEWDSEIGERLLSR